MKTALFALCTLIASAAFAAEAPEFKLDEPISLDLKDAKVTEVITLLGAIAHLPVTIDPAIQGSVTIQLKDVPYSAALRKVSEPLGFTLKIEGGKLVAAPRRSVSSPESRAAVAAGRLPDGSRVAVKDYRGAFKELSPLFVRWRSAGLDRCARLTSASGPTFDADGSTQPRACARSRWESPVAPPRRSSEMTSASDPSRRPTFPARSREGRSREAKPRRSPSGSRRCGKTAPVQ